MAYYKYINGKKYDKALLDLTDTFVNNRRDGRISLEDIICIMNSLTDGSRITETETIPLDYIVNNYNITPLAMNYYNNISQ